MARLIAVLLLISSITVSAQSGNRKEGARMICKYCGREVKSAAGKLTFQGSDKCTAAPNGKHVLISIPGTCVYCGRPVRTVAGKLVFQGSPVCNASPTKKHQLQD